MILEIATLTIRVGQESEFEAAYVNAAGIISGMPGYISHQLHHCVENKSQYVLLVNWQTLEHHTVGFRDSQEYQEWKRLLHHFYEPAPTVLHYTAV